jgi:hypothetical protein
MVVPTEAQNVTPRKPTETIEISVPVAKECAEVAAKLDIPVRAVRDVVAAHGTDILQRKLVNQVARIYAAHVNGLLPAQTGPAAPVPGEVSAR